MARDWKKYPKSSSRSSCVLEDVEEQRSHTRRCDECIDAILGVDPEDAEYVLAKFLILERGHHYHVVPEVIIELNESWEPFEDIPTERD